MIAARLLAVIGRFPLTLLFLLGLTVVAVGTADGWAPHDTELALRLGWGSVTGATLSLAGALYREGNGRGIASAFLGLVLPIVTAAAVVTLPSLLVHAPMLLCASLLFLSVAAHLGTQHRERDFAWFVRVAVREGLFALVLVATMTAGLFAIEAAFSTLLGWFNGNAMTLAGAPILIFFVGPAFWLARLPPALRAPEGADHDLLARSIQLVGSWAITPSLFIYAAILLLYMGQMLVSWRLPSNTIGWMVLSFIVTGAANWLLLAGHDDRGLVGVFRRLWFWLTLPPLALLVVALSVRIGSHGITPNRMTLAAGAAWGALVTLTYLRGRGDLRVIPLLGAIAMAVIAIGPLNLNAVSARDQAARLAAVFDQVGVKEGALARPLSETENRRALAAMNELFFDPLTRPMLDDVLAQFDLVMVEGEHPYEFIRSLGYNGTPGALEAEAGAVTETHVHAWLDRLEPVDVSGAPLFLGEFDLPHRSMLQVGSLGIGFAGGDLVIGDRNDTPTSARALSMHDWLANETQQVLSGSTISFKQGGRDYLLLPTSVTATRTERDGESSFYIKAFRFLLFAAREEASN